MKTVVMDRGREIKTPWLNVEEAAKYVDMSLPTFIQQAADVACSGSGRNRKYNIKDLDAWMLQRK